MNIYLHLLWYKTLYLYFFVRWTQFLHYVCCVTVYCLPSHKTQCSTFCVAFSLIFFFFLLPRRPYLPAYLKQLYLMDQAVLYLGCLVCCVQRIMRKKKRESSTRPDFSMFLFSPIKTWMSASGFTLHYISGLCLEGEVEAVSNPSLLWAQTHHL